MVTKTINVCSVIEENLSRGLLNTLSLKETRFSLYGLGGLQSLLLINSPDIIADIKGLSYLSDYMVIRATLCGAF